ncbi:hypothetical protein T11_1366 [Trichinella zimbabwensis]|uniref:Uncharacterized protein n=1 Tax=Trichinella zimbabwensis TaxID=268475 RepID=A0A0V1I8Z1_9BILA|nr:hypothetical protein T11_1366 [Trichinella zimbabwensis]
MANDKGTFNPIVMIEKKLMTRACVKGLQFLELKLKLVGSKTASCLPEFNIKAVTSTVRTIGGKYALTDSTAVLLEECLTECWIIV